MSFQVVILCAGYGTRLQNELEKENIFQYLRGVPKPLLPVGTQSLISHWINLLKNVSTVSEIIIVTNSAYKNCYEEFVNQIGELKKPLRIVSDGSVSNETRSGAIACMQLGAKDGNLDTFIVAGDTLFDKSFIIEEMFNSFAKLKLESSKVCLITSTSVTEENISKHGIIEVDDRGQVQKFLEKPRPHETSSRLQSPCCYFISKDALSFIHEFLHATSDQPLDKRDAPGNFIQFLVTKIPVFAFPVAKRYDIGNLSSYIECCKDFE